LDLEVTRPLIGELDAVIPRLAEYRNVMGHAVDDGLDRVAWFGPFAAELLPGGSVKYVLDVRDEHHDALERFFDGLVGALEPLCSEAMAERIAHARRSRGPRTE
jgi:hypothetical protein